MSFKLGGASAVSDQFSAATSHLAVATLSYWERAIRHEIYSAEYRHRFFKFKITPRSHGAWLNLFNGNGFHREAALRELSVGAPNPFLFAAVMRRLNDWVPQVRDAACESIRRIASRTESDCIVEAIWGVYPYVHSWGRLQVKHREALVDVADSDDVAARLATRLTRTAAGPASVILSQACRRSAMDNYLACIAVEAVQPAVRARAYKTILEGQAKWVDGRKWVWTDKYWCKGRFEPVLGKRNVTVDEDQLEILHRAARDKSPVVRRVAGSTIIEKLSELGQNALPLAQLLASDPYPSIAERGQFALDRIA